jgi:hypothetical protein
MTHEKRILPNRPAAQRGGGSLQRPCWASAGSYQTLGFRSLRRRAGQSFDPLLMSVNPLRSERHSDSDLIRALSGGIRHHAVDVGCGQRQGDYGENK